MYLFLITVIWNMPHEKVIVEISIAREREYETIFRYQRVTPLMSKIK